MADHSKFLALAKRLIAKHGRLLTLQELGAVPADPSAPWRGPGAPTVKESLAGLYGVFVTPQTAELGRDVISPELLKRTEQVVYVEPAEEGLERMHRILDTDGQLWKVEWVQVLKPALQTVLYLYGVSR